MQNNAQLDRNRRFTKEEIKELEETGVIVNNEGILRWFDTGRYVKGTKVTENSHRPKGSLGFRRRLEELVGDDGRDVALLLAEIAFYNQKDYKDRFPRFTATDKLRALEIILKYTQEPMPTRIEAKVETKSLNVSLSLSADLEEDDF